jgi:hypothetical protein
MPDQSPDEVVRAELLTWVDGLALLPGLRTNAEPPEPNQGVVTLPLATAWFGATRLKGYGNAKEAGYYGDRLVWDVATMEGDGVLEFQLNNSTDSKDIRFGFRNSMAVAALKDGSEEMGLVIELPVTIFGQSRLARVYWTGDDVLATPAQTAVDSLWRLQFSFTARFPWLAIEPAATVTDTMDLTVEVNNDPDPPFDYNDIPE